MDHFSNNPVSTLYPMGVNPNTDQAFQQGWSRYHRSPILRLALVFAVLLLGFGFFQYKRLQTMNEARTASFIYDHLLTAVQANQEMEVLTQADTLIQDYPKAIYAPLAAFMAAKMAVSHEEWDKALKHLNFVVGHRLAGSIAEVARLRMARILTQQKDYAKALALLEAIKPVSYLSLVEELKGDIYVLQQERDKAREAYAKAVEALPMGAPLLGPLRLKQIEVGFKEVAHSGEELQKVDDKNNTK